VARRVACGVSRAFRRGSSPLIEYSSSLSYLGHNRVPRGCPPPLPCPFLLFKGNVPLFFTQVKVKRWLYIFFFIFSFYTRTNLSYFIPVRVEVRGESPSVLFTSSSSNSVGNYWPLCGQYCTYSSSGCSSAGHDANISLMLYPRRGSRDISDIPPRHPHFTKMT
jgi:hypothetical protein